MLRFLLHEDVVKDVFWLLFWHSNDDNCCCVMVSALYWSLMPLLIVDDKMLFSRCHWLNSVLVMRCWYHFLFQAWVWTMYVDCLLSFFQTWNCIFHAMSSCGHLSCMWCNNGVYRQRYAMKLGLHFDYHCFARYWIFITMVIGLMVAAKKYCVRQICGRPHIEGVLRFFRCRFMVHLIFSRLVQIG